MQKMNDFLKEITGNILWCLLGIYFCISIRWCLKLREIKNENKQLREKNEELLSESLELRRNSEKSQGAVSDIHSRLNSALFENEMLKNDLQKSKNDFGVIQNEFQEIKNKLRTCEEELQTTRNELQEAKNKHEKIKNDNKSDIEITNEFRLVFDEISNGKKCIFVHGGAGSGKSTLIHWLVEQGKIQICLAPTGLAALNINGQTIHKFFGFPPYDVFNKDFVLESLPPQTSALLQHKPTICIDEISMVRADLIDAIDRSLQQFYGNSIPFGGCQMIFVGDLYQLPPIVKNSDNFFFDPSDSKFDCQYCWYGAFFYCADVFARVFERREIKLTKVFRQISDQNFMQCLNYLRVYENIPQCSGYLNLNCNFSPSPPDGAVIISGTNKKVNAYNTSKLNAINSPVWIYEAVFDGVFCEMKDADFPNNPVIELKVGAFVMFLFNDPNKRFVNGTTGIVTSLDDSGAEVRLKSGNLVRADFHTWESYTTEWNEQLGKFVPILNGRYTQIPLTLAYAITVHKSQGKTLDSIYLDLNVFSPGQMYVALSRVKEAKDIILQKIIQPGDFKICKELQNRVEWL